MTEPHDPRALFAAERTLLAWTRTSTTLMGLGFVVERFGLFVQMSAGGGPTPLHRGVSLAIGIAFILIGVAVLLVSARRFRCAVAALEPQLRLPGYGVQAPALFNEGLALVGLLLIGYLALI